MWSKHRSSWSCRSKHTSLSRNWSKPRCFGRAGQNVSRLVELGRNLDILVAPVETYLAWSNFVELDRNIKVLSRRSKRNSIGRTWSKPRSFGRADRNISRLVELSRNIDFSVVPIKTYLAWSNLVETSMFWLRRSKRISLGRTWSKN